MPGYGSYRAAATGASLMPAAINGGGRQAFVEVFDLSQSAVLKTSGTNNLVAKIPAGHVLLSINVRSTVSLTTSTLAFGTAASAAVFGTAAAYGTTAEVTKEYLLTAQKGVELAADTEILMTSGSANLPSTGIVVVEIETSARG